MVLMCETYGISCLVHFGQASLQQACEEESLVSPTCPSLWRGGGNPVCQVAKTSKPRAPNQFGRLTWLVGVCQVF